MTGRGARDWNHRTNRKSHEAYMRNKKSRYMKRAGARVRIRSENNRVNEIQVLHAVLLEALTDQKTRVALLGIPFERIDEWATSRATAAAKVGVDEGDEATDQAVELHLRRRRPRAISHR